MFRYHHLVFCLLLGSLLASCASIMHGTKQPVSVSSAPTGATVYLNGQLLGKTPVVADVSRKTQGNRIRLELEGYEAKEIALSRSVSGWVWGNIIFGGLIGLVVDASTGGMYKITPEVVMTNLSTTKPQGSNHEHLYITVVMDIDPQWEKIGQLKKLR